MSRHNGRQKVPEKRRAAPSVGQVVGAIQHEGSLEKCLSDMSKFHAKETASLKAEIVNLTRENRRLRSELAFIEQHPGR